MSQPTPSTPVRIHRYRDRADLAAHVAARLLDHIESLQRSQDVVHLCLCGGATADAVLSDFAGRVAASSLDPGRLELWWSDERFIAAGDVERRSHQVLTRLAGAFPLDPARTHLMPTPVGGGDVSAAAMAYAAELGDTRFDLALLSMGKRGRVAALYPGCPMLSSSSTVIGFDEPHLDPPSRLSLTPVAFNRSRRVWIMATTASRAAVLPRAIAGERGLPAAMVAGQEATEWFVDAAAAQQLPYHHCAA